MRSYLLVLSLVVWMPARAEGPAPEPLGLPPPVEHVLQQLSLDDTQRSAVHQLLLDQRDERRAQGEALRQKHRAALRQWLSVDQLVAVEAALPPRHAPPATGVRTGRPRGRHQIAD